MEIEGGTGIGGTREITVWVSTNGTDYVKYGRLVSALTNLVYTTERVDLTGDLDFQQVSNLYVKLRCVALSYGHLAMVH